MSELVVKIGGQAGQGANVTGRTLGKVFARSGLNVVGYPEYPSLVRGGHNVYEVRVSDKGIRSPIGKCNVIVALNKDAVFFHHKHLMDPGAIIYNKEMKIDKFKVSKKVKLYPLPIKEILEKAKGNKKMENVVMAGALLALIDYPLNDLNDILDETFGRKGKEVVEANINCAKISYEYVKENFDAKEFPLKIEKGTGKGKMIIGGNEAAGLGAIAGGLKFYAAYPMTPASSLLHYLAKVERKANIVVKHTEDEIAAINYAVGAAYAGVRSMTGTSGGGFALMTETVGMAALAETPLVVYLAQRTGPSTGMPTWTEQADLKFALNASQGDFLRVIFAPGSVEESFYLTAGALNIAEKYQLPVMILTDKFLAESHFSCDRFDQSKIKIERGKIATNLPKLGPMERFKRYKITKDGTAPRSFPGEPNGIHVATSYVHDETGFTTESFVIRTRMVQKRERKLPHLLKDLPKPKTYGPKDAEITLIAWGSHLLPCLDAIERLKKEKITVNLIHFNVVFPIDEKEVNKLFSKCKKTIMVENNSTAQFAGVLRENTGFVPDFYLLRFDGRPFFPENIVEKVKELMKKKFKEDKKIIVKESDEAEYYNTQKFGL